jgi:hypothetical protein
MGFFSQRDGLAFNQCVWLYQREWTDRKIYIAGQNHVREKGWGGAPKKLEAAELVGGYSSSTPANTNDVFVLIIRPQSGFYLMILPTFAFLCWQKSKSEPQTPVIKPTQ